MKKTKVISIILTVVIMLSSISMGAYASNARRISYLSLKDHQQVGLLQKTLDSPFKVNYKAANASPYRFYDQLSSIEKEMYNGFVSTQAGMKSSNGDFSIEVSMDSIFYNEDETFDSIFKALAAVIDDVPELYWLLAAPYDLYIDETNSGDILMTFEFDINYTPYNSFAQLKQEYNDTLTAAENFPVSGSTRYEKVMSIAENICDLAAYADIDYSETAGNSTIFFPSSCLLYPYSTVCDGYSKAFKMICDANNIPSLVVCGYASDGEGNLGGHAWNYVLMDDNRWYAVDLTWMDDDISDIYDYEGCFLVGSDTIYWDDLTFSDVHIPAGDRFEGVYLNYPMLSRIAYDPSNPVKALIGDVNFDGQTRIVDAKYVLQNVARIKNFDSNQFRAADTNKDNKITIVDAKKILKVVSGLE